MPTPIQHALKIFYSYAHEDELLRDELETHLAILKNQGLIVEWHDRKLTAGCEWAEEINEHLNQADIILLLISPHFIASSYCWDKEMEIALQRHDAKQATVVPILIRPVDWKHAPFGKLQALPKDAIPVTRWQDRDEAWCDVTHHLRGKIEAIVEARNNQRQQTIGLRDIHGVLTEEIERLDGRYQNENTLGGIPTGLADLDQLLDGLHPGDFFVIGSAPLMGKTELALNIAGRVATEAGLPVTVFSMRWAAGEVVRWLTASIAFVPSSDLLRGTVRDTDWEKLVYAIGRLNDAPILVDDQPRTNITSLAKSVRLAKEKYGAVALVVIDSLEDLAASSDTLGSKHYGALARELKKLAREMNLIVIATCQLSLRLEARPNKRPFITDLGDWQCLREEADVIAMLYRDEIYTSESPDCGVVELILAKNPRGPIKTIKLSFFEPEKKFDSFGG